MGSTRDVSPSYSVREARAADVDLLVQFTLSEAREAEAVDLGEEAVTAGVAAAFADQPPSRYWIGECSGEAVASVSVVREWSNFHAGEYWWIQSLFIVPDHRGRGLIDLLFERVAASAREAGALDLRLYVHNANARALRAYQRLGFQQAPYVMMHRDLPQAPRRRR